MTRYFLGVDIGGSKSHALLAHESGVALNLSQAGPGNHEVVGYHGLMWVLQELMEQTLDATGITKDQIAGAGFGVAGYDWPSEREPTLQVIESLELGAPLEVVNDTIIGLLAGAPQGWGVVVTAGTSCNCRGRDRHGREGRVVGHAWMGEAAGAGELVLEAIRAVAREWSRRGPPTRLTQAFVECVGAGTVEALLEGLSTGRYHLSAADAPVVFRVAAEGDALARELILWAGRELGSLAVGVIHQLGFEPLEFDVVLAGSFFNGSPRIAQAMRETIHRVAPGARLIRLTAPPVVGAVLLGMEQAGLETLPLREPLIESTNDLVA